MNRKKILETASSYVTVDREEQYGTPEDNFGIVAEFWNTFLGDAKLNAHDVAIMMCLLKIARITSGQKKEDNYIDLAGYSACAGEIATRVFTVKDHCEPWNEVENK